jgi:DNA-directed RNA polymerase subunit beta'
MMEGIGTDKVRTPRARTVEQKSMNSIYIMADSGARGSRRRSASWPACAA